MIQCCTHGIQHNLVLAHAKIIIGTPIDHFFDVVFGMPYGGGETAPFSLYVIEHTIVAGLFQLIRDLCEFVNWQHDCIYGGV
jgi:hypothetical protein